MIHTDAIKLLQILKAPAAAVHPGQLELFDYEQCLAASDSEDHDERAVRGMQEAPAPRPAEVPVREQKVAGRSVAARPRAA